VDACERVRVICEGIKYETWAELPEFVTFEQKKWLLSDEKFCNTAFVVARMTSLG
jgi:hypothetical protein